MRNMNVSKYWFKNRWQTIYVSCQLIADFRTTNCSLFSFQRLWWPRRELRAGRIMWTWRARPELKENISIFLSRDRKPIRRLLKSNHIHSDSARKYIILTNALTRYVNLFCLKRIHSHTPEWIGLWLCRVRRRQKAQNYHIDWIYWSTKWTNLVSTKVMHRKEDVFRSFWVCVSVSVWVSVHFGSRMKWVERYLT